MRLVTYREAESWRSGVLLDGWLLDSRSLLADGGEVADWRTNRELLATSDAVARLSAVCANGDGSLAAARVAPEAEATIGPPIPAPEKIVCVGLNYREHVEETERAPGLHPEFFAKFANSLIGPADVIPLPGASSEIDYEGELALVVGSTCRDVGIGDALDHIAGVMVFNDVTARDLQRRGSQWLLGKAIDGFGPCGPALVTLDELPGLDDLAIETRVNGEVVQSATTQQMIFPPAEIVAEISKTMTLVPGDVIATGTPGGVGSRREPPRWLGKGDVVEVTVEGVGTLRNECR